MENSAERLCPAKLAPLLEIATEVGSAAAKNSISCDCATGPLRRNIEFAGVQLPIKDPRAGAFVCGKTLEELNN